VATHTHTNKQTKHQSLFLLRERNMATTPSSSSSSSSLENTSTTETTATGCIQQIERSPFPVWNSLSLLRLMWFVDWSNLGWRNLLPILPIPLNYRNMF
jgi:hypothetical protein